ncbi:branched-chain amino acid ABC transporter permease [Alphaproteobacteria bacterium]|jgi:branched-chain amino acid transport system permease protein|nr:branched-chain amino acid ABC transporter permease [Alphaproteobacteria bacterium]|tara:strand:- start:542 stop:1411 length:870 start_codon:yes stop_codon:yes gene_type:complete
MDEIFDIFLLEAIVNGILFGGVLALLSLGLNLIFGVVDVVWICYAELVMFGMYTMYWLAGVYDVPILLAAIAAIGLVSIMGLLVHVLIIAPILGSPPINQLLATGGLLFFLQSVATLMWSIEFRNLGLKLPILEFSEMYFSYARLLAFGVALVGMAAVYLFLTRTYIGAAIRAISQDREVMVLMGVDEKKVYWVTAAIGGGLAGLAACLLVLQYDVHPFVGISFGPITFIICVLGGLGNMLGGFLAAFILSIIISIGGLYSETEWGYVLAFVFFIIVMFIRPQGLLGKK